MTTNNMQGTTPIGTNQVRGGFVPPGAIVPPVFDKTFRQIANDLTASAVGIPSIGIKYHLVTGITLGRLLDMLKPGEIQYDKDNRGLYRFSAKSVNSVRKSYDPMELGFLTISDEGVFADGNSRIRGLELRRQDGNLTPKQLEGEVTIMTFDHAHFMEVYRSHGMAVAHSNSQKLTHPGLYFCPIVNQLVQKAGLNSLWHNKNFTVIPEALVAIEEVGTGQYEDSRDNTRGFDVRTLYDFNAKMLMVANLEAGSTQFRLSNTTLLSVEEAMARLNKLYNLVVSSKEAVNGNGKMLPGVEELLGSKSLYKYLLSDCLADSKKVIDQVNDSTIASRLIAKSDEVITASILLNMDKKQGAIDLHDLLRTRMKSVRK